MEWIEFVKEFGVPGGLMTVVILLILNGKLVPKSYYDDSKADRDSYKEANVKLMQANFALISALNQLSDVHGKTTSHFFDELNPAKEHNEPPGTEGDTQ